MFNALCSYREQVWRMMFFPRRKHRPDVYFKEGDERVLVSPAAVDIGGLVIMPLEKDFMRADALMLEAIFNEVCFGGEFVEQITKQLKDGLT